LLLDTATEKKDLKRFRPCWCFSEATPTRNNNQLEKQAFV